MGSELVILVMIGIAWFYSEELLGFLQLDRAARMANRKLDRLEAEVRHMKVQLAEKPRRSNLLSISE